MSTQLFNTRTRKPETLPEDQIDAAILSGSHAYTRGTQVNVVGPDGEEGSVSAEELPELLSGGFRIERPMEGAVKDYVAKNQGVTGALKTFLSATADEALLGIPGVAYSKLADPLEVAKTRALQKDNMAADVVGRIAGVGASLVYGGPLFKASEVAGRGAVKAAEKALPFLVKEQLINAGVKRGADSIAKTIVQNAATKAVQLGAEGAVFAAPRALTEAAFGDLDAATEAVVAGGLGGAVFGGALGGTAPIIRAAADGGKKIRDYFASRALSKAEQQAAPTAELADLARSPVASTSEGTLGGTLAGQADTTLTGTTSGTATGQLAGDIETTLAGQLDGTITPQGPALTTTTRETLATPEQIMERLQKVEGLTKEQALKRTANEAISRGQRIGVEVPEWSLFDNPWTTQIYTEAAKLPGGGAIARQIQSTYKGLGDVVEAVFGKSDEASAALTKTSAGQAFKSTLINRLKQANQKFTEGYSKVTEAGSGIALDDAARLQFVDAVEKSRDVLFGLDDSTANALRKIADKTLKAENIKELDSLISNLGAEMDALKVSGRGSQSTILAPFREQLKAIRNQAFDAGAAQEAKTLRAQLDAEYRPYKELIKEFAAAGKLGKKRNLGPLIEALEGKESAQIVDAFFNVKKPEQLQWLANTAPEAFNLLRQYKINEIGAKVANEQGVNFTTLNRILEGLPPETKRLLFNEQALRALDDVRFITQSINKNMNPSGTAAASAIQRAFDSPLSTAVSMLPTMAATSILTGKGASKINAALSFISSGKIDAKAATAIDSLIRADFVGKGLSKIEEAIAQTARKVDEVAEVIASKAMVAPTGAGPLSQLAVSKANALTAERLALYDVVRLFGAEMGRERDEIKITPEQYKKLQEKIDDATSSPSKFRDYVFQKFDGVEMIAPQMSDKMVEKLYAQAMVYKEALPRPNQFQSPFSPVKYVPSELELQKFARKVRVANEPLTIIEQLKLGTLDRESVEVVAKLYPSLLQSIRSKAMDAIASNPSGFDYQTRLQLSQLLGLSIDPTSNPSFLLQMQQMLGGAQTPQEQAAQVGRVSGQVAQSAMTDAQKLEARG